jgi:hypothetical protein
LTLVEAVLKELNRLDGGGVVSHGFAEAELIGHLTAMFTNVLSPSGKHPYDAPPPAV